MIYPDEEKVTYSYNRGGLLEKIRCEKSYSYDYITKLSYDKFELRSYLKYCNGAETFYTYDNHRRLSNLAVNSGGTSIMGNTAAQRWLFGGKELDRISGLDLYDFEARVYDPAIARFTSPDRLQEKKTFISPYLYCRSNPIMFVDPTGLDEWEIDKNGKIVKHIKTNKHDAFFIVDNKGKRVDGKSLTFKYGTVLKASTITLKKEKGKEKETADVYKIRGDKQGTQLFEFLAKNTSVEWSHAKTGQEGSKGLNFISSSHHEERESTMTSLIRKQLKYGYSVRTINHSHPGNTRIPSGFGEKPGDIQYAAGVIEALKQPVEFNIFIPSDSSYIPFSPESKEEDFDSN